MKNRIFTLLLLTVFTGAFATVRTVSNSLNSPGQYNNLQTAINSASSGDTIYVHPSNISYGAISINKVLTVFGAGYDSRTYELRQIATIGSVTLAKNGTLSTASGSQLNSLNINGSVSIGYPDTIFNITISRCLISSTVYTTYNTPQANTNWSIINCSIIGTIYLQQSANNLIANNFLESGINTGAAAGNNMVTNNVFEGSYTNYLNACYNVLFTNNIFFNTSVNSVTLFETGTTGNVVNNNLTYDFSGNIILTGNSGANNIADENPQFTNAPTAGQAMNYDSIVSYNFQLLSTSPGHHAGTDSTDLGVYGGTYSFQNVAGTSALPQVILLNILNPAIPANGTLNVTSTGVKRN
jgi:hypothetical protein